MNTWLMVLIPLICFAFHIHAADQLELVTAAKKSSYTLAQLKSHLKTHVIKIYDPVFKAEKSYEAFLLTDVLALVEVKLGSGGDELVFTAKDGYSPNLSFTQLSTYQAYLAFKEKSGQFKKVRQGKSMVSPAPFYVVWESGKSAEPVDEKKVPWAYQVVKIEVVDFKKKYPKVYPPTAKPDSAEQQGFVLFKNHCIRCHSINLQGGEVGPELNIPKNVTEYWDPDHLIEFIRDASSFRARSKMPAFPNISEDEADSIVTYLSAMKAHKIKD